MPAYELPLKVGASNVRLVCKGEEYPIDIDARGFTRVGEDGSIKVLSLFGGDEFVGKVLEGHWVKGWDANINADQVFTAILDGAGVLEFEGEADAAGTAGYGWINSKLPIPLLDETEITVAMSVPIDDTGSTADRDISLHFELAEGYVATVPYDWGNQIRFKLDVDESGLWIWGYRRVSGSYTNLFTGSTYDDATSRGTGDIEAAILRFVFHGKPGTSGSHMHVYLKQSDTIDNAEAANENELSTSPYDMSTLRFNIAYPSLFIGSQNTSYFDAGQEAKVGYIRVSYPNFTLKQKAADANLFLNEVELWDGDPDSGGIRVYDADHAFSNDPYMQNGIARLYIDNGASYGMKLYAYISAAWLLTIDRFYNYYNSLNVVYVWLKKIVYLSPEKVTLLLRTTDTGTDDDGTYTEFYVTLRKGSPILEFEWIKVVPTSYKPQIATLLVSAPYRFGYSQDDDFNDVDLAIAAQTNTVQTDNWVIKFDNAGVGAVLSCWAVDKKSTSFYLTTTAVYYGYIDLIIEINRWYVYVIPFSLIANLFAEAEDATLAAGADTEDLADDSGTSARLNAQNETVTLTRVAGTQLPAGRYLAVMRIEDTNQVAGDVGIQVYNSSDSVFRNEEGAEVAKTVTAAWLYYSIVFDITDADVTGTDNIDIRVKKLLADANTIYVDYFLIVPIGNGFTFPQDTAHSSMRQKYLDRRIDTL